MSETVETVGVCKLAAKLLHVMADVQYVQKTGRNERQNYSYVREADIVAKVREALVQHGVWMQTSVLDAQIIGEIATRDGGKLPISRVRLDITFLDPESGETLSSHWVGDGMDAGDKGVYKAITGATKYALLKSFLIPTGDDPEDDAGEVHPPSAPTTGRGPLSPTTPTPPIPSAPPRPTPPLPPVTPEPRVESDAPDPMDRPAPRCPNPAHGAMRARKGPSGYFWSCGEKDGAAYCKHTASPITPKQVGRIFAIATDRGYGEPALRKGLLEVIGVQHFHQLVTSKDEHTNEYDRYCTMLERGELPPF